MIRLTAITLAALLTGCATCKPPPGPPVWALATVPDDASYNSQVLYLIAENAQRRADSGLVPLTRLSKKKPLRRGAHCFRRFLH